MTSFIHLLSDHQFVTYTLHRSYHLMEKVNVNIDYYNTVFEIISIHKKHWDASFSCLRLWNPYCVLGFSIRTIVSPVMRQRLTFNYESSTNNLALFLNSSYNLNDPISINLLSALWFYYFIFIVPILIVLHLLVSSLLPSTPSVQKLVIILLLNQSE